MLRRTAVLVCLLAPLAAAAQSSTLTFGNSDTFGKDDCLAAPASAADPILSFDWTMVPSGTPLTSWTWQVKALPAGGNCATDTGTTNVLNTSTMAWSSNTASYPGNTGDGTLYLSRVVTVAGASCSASTSIKIHICVQLFNGTTLNASVSKDLVVELTAPTSPTGTAVSPGDTALNVSWDSVGATSSTPAASSYRVDVKTITCNPVPDPLTASCLGTVVATKNTGGTSLRIGGLTNGVPYGVQVYAISAGGNVSLASDPPVLGMPIPVYDYWEQYKRQGGPDPGGCAAGSAGALSLLAVAGLVRALRRRP